jgi:hypothetical protein
MGFTSGLIVGLLLRNAWSVQILAALGLPAESFMDDIVAGLALAGYGAAIFVGTYVPTKASMAG